NANAAMMTSIAVAMATLVAAGMTGAVIDRSSTWTRLAANVGRVQCLPPSRLQGQNRPQQDHGIRSRFITEPTHLRCLKPAGSLHSSTTTARTAAIAALVAASVPRHD